MPYTKAGVFVGRGALEVEDVEALRQAQVEAVKLRVTADPAVVGACRDAGVRIFLGHLLSDRPGQEPTAADLFVDEVSPGVEVLLAHGVTDFEVHGEPNTGPRGYGVSWADARAFSDWFLEAAERLRTRFGPTLRLGFPALAPPGPRLVPEPPAVSDEVFLAACGEALAAADFVCCQTFWTSWAQMRDYHGGLRFLRAVVERTDKPVIVSAFANVNPAEPAAAKGGQYAEFYFLSSQYDRLEGVYACRLRRTEPDPLGLAWVGTDIPNRVAQRRRMPHPAALRLAWPTETRAYTQGFGERQQRYFEASYDPDLDVHWLHGGHEGVDLQAAEGSPVRACLPGRVAIGRPGTAYGNYVRVVSQVPEVGEVTLLYAHLQQILVEDGATVVQGEVLGLAGQTGNTTGPHLHLGMRIRGLTLRPTSHYLNARPYLEPVRGTPREPYERTYVLLPPGADEEWALAVVDASWDAHRFTVGGSADDAGIGDLEARRVIAVNPDRWPGDLRAFFDRYYPGVVYVAVEAATPEELKERLREL